MIQYLQGMILGYKDHVVTLGVHGVGFQVFVAEKSLVVGQKTELHIHLQWHQEHGPMLYGFQTELEKSIFLLVISCSGIGPKIALAILSDMKPATFLKIIQTGDHKALSTVNGIGAKKAEQMIVQLRHKAAKLIESGVADINDAEFHDFNNISEVLTSLHYSRSEISQALQHIKESTEPSAPFDQLLRKALSYLSKRI
jgi:holliday junction DNA helicase RuvA